MTRQELYNKLDTPTVANVIANDLFDEAQKHVVGVVKTTLIKAIATVLFHESDVGAGFEEVREEVSKVAMQEHVGNFLG